MKRGRPKSQDTSDPAILRRRELRVIRTARFRENRAARIREAQAVPVTVEQQQQTNTIIERLPNVREVAPEDIEIGLRVQGLILGICRLIMQAKSTS